MAWWAQKEIDDEFRKRISYRTEWMGDSKQRLDAAMRQVADEMIAKHFTPDPGPRPWRASVYDPIVGSGPTIGFRQPMNAEPYKLRFVEEVGYLPEIYDAWIITSRIRDVIEGLEPGVHQYLPCELYYKDGSLVPGERWLLNICNRLDTIAVEHCNIVVHPILGTYMTGNGKTDVKVWKEKVAGHAIWSEWKYNDRTYVSDALAEAIKALGVNGWAFRQYLPEV